MTHMGYSIKILFFFFLMDLDWEKKPAQGVWEEKEEQHIDSPRTKM